MKFSPIVIILSISILCSFQVNAAVKWNNNSNTSAEKKLSPINLAKYNMFRKLDFDISGEQYKSFAAYNQGKDLLGFKASGILFFQDEVCNWRSRISNRKTKTGSFVANCPSGITVKGKYTYVGNNQGSYGSGKDNFGRLIKYVLGGVGSSNKREIQSHYNELKSKINSSTTQIASATTSSSAARASSIVVPEDNCGEVSLAEMNWASSQIMVAVDKLLLRAAFGCDVKVVSGTNISTFETMKRHSFPDVAGELWINGIYEQFKKEVRAGKLSEPNVSPISFIGEGWWVTPSVIRKHPELKTLEDILQRPDLFPHPSNPHKGAFHNCPSGWGCNIANRQLFKAFKMKEKGWLLVEPNSSDTMDKSIGRAVETKTNWFGYYWSPTALVGRYDLKVVEFGIPFKGKQNWERCIVDQQCRNPQPSRWINSIVRTVLTSEFKQREKLASTYLENRSFTNDVMNELLDFISNGKSADAAARKFLAEYPEIWHKWLPLKRLKVTAASLGLPTTVRVANSSGKSGEENQSNSFARTAETNSLLSNSTSSAELAAAQRKAERLEAELAALKAEQQQEQQTISNDTLVPLIDQVVADTIGKQGIVTGRVRDNTGIAELTVDGAIVQVKSDGRFEHRTFIPAGGKQVLIEVTDLAGLTSQKQLSLSRDTAIQSASISFDSLNPLGKSVAKNRDALALIVGVETYEQTPAQAVYADSDAKMFRDYASEKLGIPDNRIETLINDGAELTDMLLSVKNWLARSVKQDRTDVYVFFAGHGLASDDGEKMYLLPYDGSPQLLDRTAILRDELFSDIAAANPRSVTVFLDTCYSGTTRGTDMLVASRPIAIRAKQQNIPDGFTVFTAAGGDQTAKPLEEAKHGMFSYFLMKGMEGDADSNRDNQITAAELHEYVEQNVVQQSGGSQVPELQGDAGRVLVRFQ